MTDPKRIADYAIIGDLRTAALVDRGGSIDWACMPRFDGDAVFAALIGTPENGSWRIAPAGAAGKTSRRYRGATLVLETTFETAAGDTMRLVDFMPTAVPTPTIVRIVEGVRGSVACESRLAPRMHYGLLPPWTRHEDGAWTARASPDGLALRTTAQLDDADHTAGATFDVHEGERVAFALQWFPAHAQLPAPLDALAALAATVTWWEAWSANFAYDGEWRESVLRSAIALKALSSVEHGSFVAAVTTSLPEKIGGDLNWDYRYTWLRDSSFASESLLRTDFVAEAAAWRDWFLRVCVGEPQHLHIMYGAGGERIDPETTLPWLAGFARSQPVRIANGAHAQFQLGVYGDLLAAFEHAQEAGVTFDAERWSLIEPLLEFIDANWQRPDNGIWEKRTGGRQYVDSKVMVWVGLDRALKLAQRGDLPIDAPRWRTLMARVHDQICSAGFDAQRNTFTQYYGSKELDASLLLIPILGFLPPEDPRVAGTVEAIEDELLVEGYVYRYTGDDAGRGGAAPIEGAFSMCGFWLVQAYTMLGRHADARALFGRLVATANDVGLLAEEYDVAAGIPIGNYPQAFSHAGLIDAACRLTASPRARLESR